MQKIVMTGVMLLGIVSCKNAPTIKNPVEMYSVSLRFNEAAKGQKYLNYKMRKKYVGEWVNPDELEFIPLSEAPEELQCFSQKTWLTVVKPKLKQASDYYHRK